MKIKVLNLKPTAWFVPFSWLIKETQGTNFSHMAIQVFQDVLDATTDGVKWTHADDYKKKYKTIKETEIEIKDLTNLYSWANEVRTKNQGYSFSQNFGLGLKRLGLIKTNPFGRNARRLVCCELVIIFLRKFEKSYQFTDTDSYDLVMTDEIVQYIHDRQGGNK